MGSPAKEMEGSIMSDGTEWLPYVVSVKVKRKNIRCKQTNTSTCAHPVLVCCVCLCKFIKGSVYVCVCVLFQIQSSMRCVHFSEPVSSRWISTHPCLLVQDKKSVRAFIDLCASVYVFLFHDIKLQVMCLRKCVGESMQRPDLLCCIAARPAQPEVAVVLRQGILPRSQQVNPPHLHTQPLQG